MKKTKCQTRLIFDVEDLRSYCEENSQTPDDENKFFVAYHYIDGDTTENLVMTVIWTTPNFMNRISTKMLQDDATYKMNW